MGKIYACLIGEWVCLNDDENCIIGENGSSPYVWYEENAEIFSPLNKTPDTYYQLDYVNLVYKNVHYRINPIFIQIVNQ